MQRRVCGGAGGTACAQEDPYLLAQPQFGAGFGAAAGTAPVWEAAGFAAGAAVLWRVSDTPGVAALGALGARGRDAF
mgnify:CR=1 FL=1